jgi:hypothetical protein
MIGHIIQGNANHIHSVLHTDVPSFSRKLDGQYFSTYAKYMKVYASLGRCPGARGERQPSPPQFTRPARRAAPPSAPSCARINQCILYRSPTRLDNRRTARSTCDPEAQADSRDLHPSPICARVARCHRPRWAHADGPCACARVRPMVCHVPSDL